MLLFTREGPAMTQVPVDACALLLNHYDMWRAFRNCQDLAQKMIAANSKPPKMTNQISNSKGCRG